MSKVYIVYATGPNYSELFIAAYTNPAQAQAHADFVNGVDNAWRATVKFAPLYSTFEEGNDFGVRDIEYDRSE